MSSQDPRIAELTQIAREEGITLPMPPATIIWFEDRGYVVDLVTGMATPPVVGMPTPSAQAVAHLLAHEVGELAL
jgi:hypothetical protein